MKVLIVDGEPVMAEMIAFAFKREGFQVTLAQDGITALQTWAKEKPDLVILEIDLPKLDGFTVCQRIRKENRTPVIFLTAKADEENELLGLELGADVYMTKPFSPRQLVARARAILRRTTPMMSNQIIQSSMPVYAKTLDDWGTSLRTVSLAPLEKRLLEYLVLNPGRVLTYESLIRHVWGNRGGDRDMLRHLIRRLRRKIETDPANPAILKTIPGLGYTLEEQPKAS